MVTETASMGHLNKKDTKLKPTFTNSDGAGAKKTGARGTQSERRALRKKSSSGTHKNENIPEVRVTPLTRSIEEAAFKQTVLQERHETTKDLLLSMGEFSAVARAVKNTLKWKVPKAAESFMTVGKNKDDVLVFDKSLFTRHRRTYGGLTDRARAALAKPVLDRTKSDAKVLLAIINRIHCFEGYPKKVRTSIARHLHLDQLERNRVVIRQGHLGHSFYFIVKGSVNVQITSDGTITPESIYHVVSTLTEGSSFGEMAIVYDIKRTATVVTNEYTELLHLSRHDFSDILATHHEVNIDERLALLERIGLTRRLAFNQLLAMNKLCHLIEYEPKTVIFGNSKKPPSKVYYVVKGTCILVRDLFIVAASDRFGYRYHYLPSAHEIKTLPCNRPIKPRERNARNLQRHIWTFKELGPGA